MARMAVAGKSEAALREREELESRLQHAQRMEAIGTLAGSVAHDFNNLLTSIQGSAELLLAGTEPGSAMRRRVERIVKATARGEALTRQLLAFSRKQATHPEQLDPNAALRAAAELFAPMLGEYIAIEWALADDAGAILFDPAQFDQILINLAVNARDAMPDGGCLRISTAREQIESARAAALGIPPGEYLRASIRDSGSGIPDHVLPQIFDPFFTTKEPGKGTGLGLSTVHGIVRQHEGAVAVESAGGQGTTFHLYLPRPDAIGVDVDSASPPARETPLRTARTLLIVEDDVFLRELMEEVLKDASYRVLSAPDPTAAIEMACTADAGIDLLVTDVIMPGMTGVELAKRLTESYEGLRVLFISGYTDQLLADRGERLEGNALIHKPFGNDELCEKIAEMLACEGSD